MTKREFLICIINGEINDNVKKFAENEISKIDQNYVSIRNKRDLNNERYINLIYNEILDFEPKSAFEISQKLGINRQKVSQLLKILKNNKKIFEKRIKNSVYVYTRQKTD